MRTIPTITKNLLIINVLVFVLTNVLELRDIHLMDIFGLHFFLASDFHLYQLFTYMFVHADLQHIFFNMFALWMFSSVIENVWGQKRFLFYYLTCGIGAGLIQMVAQFFSFYLTVKGQSPGISMLETFQLGHMYGDALNSWTTVGASGAVYAVLLAFGMTFPEERIFIFPLPIPIKAKWFVVGYVAIELFSGLSSRGDNVAHFAHLGGMLFGYLMIRYWQNHNNMNEYFTGNVGDGFHFFDNVKSNWEQRQRRHQAEREKMREKKEEEHVRHQTDWEYNAQKKANQEEIDRILDKIRKSGYDSLSKEEKRKLFENKG